MVSGKPVDIIEALALLYLQEQGVAGLNCDQLVARYAEAYQEIGIAYLKEGKKGAFKMPGTGTKF